MALQLKNLDDVTRQHMAQEIQADIQAGNVYHSKFLTDEGIAEWDSLLLEAAQRYNSSWLADKLRDEYLVNLTRQITDSRGVVKTLKFQPITLADSEFNRYYIRGVCLRAIEKNIPYVITYRAKPVREALSPVGVQIDPKVLLEDLRVHKEDTENEIPSNPNSGISVHLP